MASSSGGLLGGSDQAIVLIGVADGQPQVVGERVALPERAGHETVRQERLRDRRRALGAPEVDQHEVRHRRTDRPADRAEGVGQAARARARRGRGWRSRMSGSRRASVTRVTDTVETEPGGRNGLSRAMTSGRATANPTRSPARA